jgi:hypothetical protein
VAEIGGAFLVWQSLREGARFWAGAVGAAALVAYALLASLQPDPRFGRVLAASVLFGATKGLIILLRADLLDDFYGAAHLGTIGGISALCIGVTQAGGPSLAGLVYDWAGSYTPVLRLLFGATALAVVAALVAERFAPAPAEDGELSSATTVTVAA